MSLDAMTKDAVPKSPPIEARKLVRGPRRRAFEFGL